MTEESWKNALSRICIWKSSSSLVGSFWGLEPGGSSSRSSSGQRSRSILQQRQQVPPQEGHHVCAGTWAHLQLPPCTLCLAGTFTATQTPGKLVVRTELRLSQCLDKGCHQDLSILSSDRSKPRHWFHIGIATKEQKPSTCFGELHFEVLLQQKRSWLALGATASTEQMEGTSALLPLRDFGWASNNPLESKYFQ